MLFVNHTPFAAKFIGIRLPERIDAIGMVIVKATYVLDRNGRDWHVDHEPFPITTETVETPQGIFHGEVAPPREGVDICVLATVRRSRPVRKAMVTLQVRDLTARLNVVGDRTWRKVGRTLVPSDPASFTEMPLSYRRAYGGMADHEGAKVPWADNPIGTGYYFSSEGAIGRPLQNIESTQLLGGPRWDVPVPVVGWAPYPNTWGLRVKQAYEVRDGRIVRVHRTLFNNAHPDLIVPEISSGDVLRIDGLFDVPIEYRIPSQQLDIRSSIGSEELIPRVRIDGVYLWPDERKIVVMHRTVFPYPVNRYEIRKTVVSQ